MLPRRHGDLTMLLPLLPLLLLSPTIPGDVVLPEGPAARAWASVDPATPIGDEWMSELGEDAPGVLTLSDPWSHPQAWKSWGHWLASGERTPSQSAALAILAARQGRSADAWSHYAALVADPAAAAGAMPRLLPGIPPDAALGAPLSNGCVLHPTPPPGAIEAALGRVRPVTASAEFRIADATARLVISIEPAGVEVKVHHLAGGAASFHVQLPELLEREIRVSYLDWLRQDARNDPLAIELTPDMEGPVQLFGRFLPRKERLPAIPESGLPAQMLEAGLWFEAEGDEPPTALHEAAALAITTSLGVPGGTRRASSAEVDSPSAGTVVRLSQGDGGPRTLARIAGATEAWIHTR